MGREFRRRLDTLRPQDGYPIRSDGTRRLIVVDRAGSGSDREAADHIRGVTDRDRAVLDHAEIDPAQVQGAALGADERLRVRR